MAAGTNRMNETLVAKATQGLANYTRKTRGARKKLSAVVCFDARHNSMA